MTPRRAGVPYVYAWPSSSVSSRLDLGRDVLSLSAQKGLDQPAGTWTLKLLPRTSDAVQSHGDLRRLAALYQAIEPMTVVSLGMDVPGGIMLGVVDRVERSVMWAGDQPMRGLVVSGSDLGKALAVDQVIRAGLTTAQSPEFFRRVRATLGARSPALVALEGVWGPNEPGAGGDDRDAAPTFEGQTVERVLRWVLDNAPSMRLPLLADALGGTGLVAEYVELADSITTWNHARVFAENLHHYAGSVWGFLRSVIDADVYELALQQRPREGSPFPSLHLVLRPKPFDDPDLDFARTTTVPGVTRRDLRTFVGGAYAHRVDLREVHQEQLGVSDADAISYVQVTSAHELIGNPGAESMGLKYPLLDTWGYRRWGARAYQSAMTLAGGDVARMVSGQDDYTGEVSLEVRDFRNRLFNWYRLNPYFETGQIVVNGRDEFRPGDPVHLPWALPKLGNELGLTYYCPQVSWSWSYGGPFLSSLTLTRGYNRGVVLAVKERILADAPIDNPVHFAES